MILSQNERNTGRQYAVDMVKMIAIFIMVIIHTLEHGEADLDWYSHWRFQRINLPPPKKNNRVDAYDRSSGKMGVKDV